MIASDDNSKDNQTMLDARRRFAVFVCAAAAILAAAAASAQYSLNEDFTTTDNRSAATTADWNPGLGVLRLFPYTATVVGSVDTPSAARGIDVHGDIAYVADGYSGMQIVDISDPAAPVIIGSYNTTGYAYQVQVEGNLAYVADWEHGLKVVNVQNPASPFLVGTLDTGGAHIGLAVQGNHAYVANGSAGLRVIDITDPAAPTVAADLATTTTAVRIDVDGDHACLAAGNSGLQIFDVSDPGAPVLVATLATAGYAYDVIIVGDLAYVSDQNWGLLVVDISDPASPVLAGSLPLAGISRGLHVFSHFVYLANDTDGLRIIDVADPTNPIHDHTVDLAGHAHDVYVTGEHAYVPSLGSGLIALETANTMAPAISGSVGSASPAEAHVRGNRAFVAKSAEGLQVLDISDPEQPTTIGNLDLAGGARGVDVAGDHAYVASGTGGLHVVDITDPTAPALVATFPVTQYAQGVRVAGDHAYVATSASPYGLLVLDISNPTSPTLVSSDIEGTGSLRQISIVGDYAYLRNSSEQLLVADISDPTTPVLVGSYQSPYVLYDLHIAGRYAYLAESSTGLRVVDISDPTNPFSVGALVIGGSCRGVSVNGNQAFIANHDLGLQVVNITDPTAPVLTDTFGNWGGFDRLDAGGDHVLVLDDGIILFQVYERPSDPVNNLAVSVANDTGGDSPVRVQLTANHTGQAAWDIRDGNGDWNPVTAGWSRLNPVIPSLTWRAILDGDNPPVIDDVTIAWIPQYAPITAIADVPDDQGGRVYLEVARSGYDFADEALLPVTQYGVYRQVNDPALARLVGGQASADALLPGVQSAEHDGTRYVTSFNDDFPAGTWALVATIPATQSDSYLADSTAAGPAESIFLVTTHTTTPSRWFVSDPVSGYSVDNIAPGVPTGFVAAYQADGVDLDWDDAPEVDFQFFRIYRDITLDFVPSEDNLVLETAASVWTDSTQDPWALHYKVSAVDQAGNEGEAAATGGPVGVPGAIVSFALDAAAPNPFNPATSISYSLPAAGPVELVVYDLSGHAVTTLVSEAQTAGEHSVRWLGRDAAGNQVASGVYLYRLRAGGLSETRSMTLLK